MTSYHIVLSEDALYERLVAEAGLYDVAFFGTKATAEQSRLLDDIWKIVIRIARSARQERKGYETSFFGTEYRETGSNLVVGPDDNIIIKVK